MKAVIQRVQRASVEVEGERVAEIGPGLLTLLGIAVGDTEAQLEKMMSKIIDLRIFPDDQGKMNFGLKDIDGEHLIVSQFTLLGDCRKGRRPHFMNAEAPERAQDLYERSLRLSREAGVRTLGGVFASDMKIDLLNDGPVTMIIEF